LGDTALYLISTLPEEEREKEHVTEKGTGRRLNVDGKGKQNHQKTVISKLL